jgi:hypothetical protein
MGTGEGLEEGLGSTQPIPTESIVQCTQCWEPETGPEGCCQICEKCSFCCGCGTFNTLSDEEQVAHGDPAHDCYSGCYAWENPSWPESCGDED